MTSGPVSLEPLSVVIPSYNGQVVLEECLTILAGIARDAEVIVVDGGSSDGSQALVLERFPWARLLCVPNHGWAHASNRGFEAARGEFLLTMNSDLFATRAALEGIVVRFRENRALGGLAPVLNNRDGSRQFVFGPLWPTNWNPVRTPVRTNLLPGACLAVTRTALERVGLFDEHFFFYNEEFDWCWRAARAGFALELIPQRVVHALGGSTSTNLDFQLEGLRGTLYLVGKHFPKPVAEATRALVELLGWLGMDLDPRAPYRALWARAHDLAQRRAYLESPFPLSGRGEVRFPGSAQE